MIYPNFHGRTCINDVRKALRPRLAASSWPMGNLNVANALAYTSKRWIIPLFANTEHFIILCMLGYCQKLEIWENRMGGL